MTSKKIEISPVASLHMILFTKPITKAGPRSLVSACVVRKPLKTGFLASWPISYNPRIHVLLKACLGDIVVYNNKY